MTRIIQKPAFALTALRDKTAVQFPSSDRHALDGGGLGVPRHFALDILEQSVMVQFVEAPTHGLVTGDIGKPLSFAGNTMAILSDTSSTHWPFGVLVDVPETDELMVAFTGARVRLSVDLLENGAGHSFATHGRMGWWDLTAVKYKTARQGDARRGMPPILFIIEVGATTFDAIVMPFVAQQRIMPEYMLTGDDVAASTATILPANAALDGLFFAGGIALSSEDATFTPSTGVLSWTGQGLASRVIAGMRIQGTYEPRQ
jgi:hypothetical protein